jgi:hypothetical protein
MGRNIDVKEVGVIEEWDWQNYGRGRRGVFLIVDSEKPARSLTRTRRNLKHQRLSGITTLDI